MTVYELIFYLEQMAEEGYKFNQVEIDGAGPLISVFKSNAADPKSPVMLVSARHSNF